LDKFRCLDYVRSSEPARLVDVLRAGLASDQDDWQCRVSASKPPQEFDPIHFWHVDVEKYRVRTLLAQKPEPFLRVIDDRDLVALALHGLGKQIGHDDFVIDNQDSHRRLSEEGSTEL